MNELTMLAVAAVLALLLMVTEIIAASLPIIIVVTLVPPEERDRLAQLVAACDSSRRLRLWRALRLAVKARRRQRLDSH